MPKPILELINLTISAEEKVLVNDLSFTLEKGKTLAIVGESGSGKSLSSLAIMGLLSDQLSVSGSINFNGESLLNKSEKDFLQLRGKQISMIFQEPMTALNPTMKCGLQLSESIEKHLRIPSSEAKKRAIELFEKVKLPRPDKIFESFPHQISGGQKQRVMIAIAIACKPVLLIADEPTTALDVTVQSEILDLLKDLQKEYGMAMIFISHDLGVVKEIADDVLVMLKGKTMEINVANRIFSHPKSSYTKGLLACRPTAETNYYRLPLVADFLEGDGEEMKRVDANEKKGNSLELVKNEPLFRLNHLRRWYDVKSSIFKKSEKKVKAVNDVSFEIYPGETLGLVGESGCGKTTLGKILSGLEAAEAGQMFYNEKDISKLGKAEWKEVHKEIQIIFQDPYSSLNPRITIGKAILEVLLVHQKKEKNKAELKQEVLDLLVKVGLEKTHYNRYPHEFSGGQRQRVGIARALALKPRFIVCDESVSALDVSVQAQILNLLNDLKDDFGLTYLFISHDLSVVKYISDRIIVMKNGELMEQGFADDLYNNPKNDYTKKLIASVAD